MDVALLAALFAAALIPWWPIHEHGWFLACVGVALATGLAIGAVGALRRWPSWAVALTIASAYLLLGVPLAVPSRALFGVLPTAAGMVDLLTGTALSWKQLVTVQAPVGAYQSLLVPAFLLTLVGSAISATIALRTRHPIAAVVPPSVVFASGIALGVVHEQFAVAAGLAFLVAVVAWLVRIAITRRRALGASRRLEAALADLRRWVGAAAILLVALVAAAVVAVVVPTPQRTVVRSEIQPAFELRDLRTPLAGFRNAFAPDAADRPMLAVRGLPEDVGLRLATLDTYDGVVYSVGGDDGREISSRFARLPYRIDRTGAPGEQVVIDVRVLGYEDVWVPGAGLLAEIAFGGPRAASLADEFVVNDVTGVAAVQGGMAADDSFTAESVVVDPVDDGALDTLRPGTAVLPPGPELPEELRGWLLDHTPSTGEPGERLAAAITAVRQEGYVSHGQEGEASSRSGHSLDRLVELVMDRPMVGDGEQYAVLSALFAREIGFPARVAVGYLPTADDEPDADGWMVLTGERLQAWIEVRDAEGRWIQVDPNPEVREIPDRQPEDPTEVSRPQSVPPPPEDRTPVEDLGADSDLTPDDGEGADDPWVGILLAVLAWTGVAALAVLVLASPILVIMAAKAARRRLRRRAASGRQRVQGAWQEFADLATDYGIPVPSGTRAEQAAAIGGFDSVVLAGVVDRLLYGPETPGKAEARRVWDAVDGLSRRFATDAGAGRAFRAAISLGSLGGYAGSRRGGRA